jgi:acyl-CoA synthetase (NDP forming)
MGQHNLNRIFNPRHIAAVGAGQEERSGDGDELKDIHKNSGHEVSVHSAGDR